jgi:hypothetical protein
MKRGNVKLGSFFEAGSYIWQYVVPQNWLQVQLCAVLRCQRKYCLNHVGCGLCIGLITADWRGRSS